MDTYAEKTGAFTYFEDWGGFNVPGDVIIKFRDEFYGEMRPKEWALLHDVGDFVYRRDPKFYLIGTHGTLDGNGASYVEHEMAHAYFYLEPMYKNMCDIVYSLLASDIKDKLKEKLLKMGYNEDVVPDEVQAYFSTDDVKTLQKRFDVTEAEAIDIKTAYTAIFLSSRKQKAL
jgi:hypothetical protein